jgi:hypothetical protein
MVLLAALSDVLRILGYDFFFIPLYHLPLWHVRRLFTSVLELEAFIAALILPDPLLLR